jgi:hypothetical protein
MYSHYRPRGGRSVCLLPSPYAAPVPLRRRLAAARVCTGVGGLGDGAAAAFPTACAGAFSLGARVALLGVGVALLDAPTAWSRDGAAAGAGDRVASVLTAGVGVPALAARAADLGSAGAAAAAAAAGTGAAAAGAGKAGLAGAVVAGVAFFLSALGGSAAGGASAGAGLRGVILMPFFFSSFRRASAHLSASEPHGDLCVVDKDKGGQGHAPIMNSRSSSWLKLMASVLGAPSASCAASAAPLSALPSASRSLGVAGILLETCSLLATRQHNNLTTATPL